MPRRYIDLQECLFDAFEDPSAAFTQEYRQMGAIYFQISDCPVQAHLGWPQ